MSEDVKRIQTDVLIVGAGGAGLRAAIEAAALDVKVVIVTKSLLGKAHTVMAEGGAAAALSNIDERDNWMVHFRDTMRGGKLHNDWRMAEIHAKESPARIRELEKYGAVFDRTSEGKINQRNFGGHTFPRLAHVGDRTGLEMIRTLQDEVIHFDQIDIHQEVTVAQLLVKDEQILGALGYNRQSGDIHLYQAKTVIICTGGIGKSYRITSNSWEYTGDGHALAFDVGAEIIDMEFIQFHPTGMVWPPSVKGTLVTEGVRGEGGKLFNKDMDRFMFSYIPPMFKGDYAESEEEAERWLDGDDSARRPPELLTRDVVARAITKEVNEGRGTPHGGAYLDIAWRPSEYVKKKLPSMYHQFKVLADLDITKDYMEVGPTTHYVMGGIRVDPQTQETNIKGLYAAGEAAGGLHGANRLGGNSLSDLVVFGKLAGEAAAKASKETQFSEIDNSQIAESVTKILAPFDSSQIEDPYGLHKELQEVMDKYVGIKRIASDLEQGIKELNLLKGRAEKVKATGLSRRYNPSWHQALDIKNMITSSLLAAYGALQRKESRGAHTREDFPENDESLTDIFYVLVKSETGDIIVKEEKMVPMPEYLQKLADAKTRRELFSVVSELMEVNKND